MVMQVAGRNEDTTTEPIEHRFDHTAAFSIGAEEEFVLVDPRTGECRSRAAAVLDGCESHVGSVQPEVVESVVEGITPVCTSIDQLGASLRATRTALAESARGAGCALVGTGAHPFGDDDQQITRGPRYAELARDYPWVIQQAATYGLHVHVGVQGADRAIAICNAMRPWLPHLLALSANSPLWRGERTGLQSTRVVLAQLYPRSGVPPVFEDFDHYTETIRALQLSGTVRDYTHTWWFVRPHPRLGTIELRICDAQTDVRRSIALVALVRALVTWLDDELDLVGTTEPVSAPVCEENLWAAARDGCGATFIDHVGGDHAVSAARAIRELLHVLTPYFADYDSVECVPLLQHMIDCNGAKFQLHELERRGDTVQLVHRLASITDPNEAA